MLPLNMNLLETEVQSITISTDCITYLGVKLSTKLSDLHKLNFNPLLHIINYDLQCWINLALALIGRIASIKMMILPKINYLF